MRPQSPHQYNAQFRGARIEKPEDFSFAFLCEELCDLCVRVGTFYRHSSSVLDMGRLRATHNYATTLIRTSLDSNLMPTPILPSLDQVNAARIAIKSSVVRTPLVRLNFRETAAEIYLKLENLQPIGSFKIRGATNAMGHLTPAVLARGGLTASAGNLSPGLALPARRPCI